MLSVKFHIILSLLALTSCTNQEYREAAADRQARYNAQQAATWQPPAGPVPTSPRKVKGDYTVVYQYAAPGGSNNTDQTQNTKNGQRQGSSVGGDGSTSGNASKREAGGGVPWWLLVLAGAVGWDVVSQKLGPLKWLPWRGRSG